MKRNKKTLIILSIFFFIPSIIFSDIIILKDTSFFEGNIEYFTKEEIVLKVKSRFYLFLTGDIDTIIHQQNTPNIILTLKKNETEPANVNFIKLSGGILYYKEKSKNYFEYISLAKLEDLALENQKEKAETMTQYMPRSPININNDITKLIAMLIKIIYSENYQLQKNFSLLNKTNPLEVNIENIDFYEKFWSRINSFIDDKTENTVWSLLEKYSEKEKKIYNVYNKRIQNLTNGKKDLIKKKIKISDELKNKIIELRLDFYNRAKKIILLNTYITLVQ